jgi:hypothetical protein
MPNASRNLKSALAVRIERNFASPLASGRLSFASVGLRASTQEIDWEERRWQLEWDRRNIED